MQTGSKAARVSLKISELEATAKAERPENMMVNNDRDQRGRS